MISQMMKLWCCSRCFLGLSSVLSQLWLQRVTWFSQLSSLEPLQPWVDIGCQSEVTESWMDSSREDSVFLGQTSIIQDCEKMRHKLLYFRSATDLISFTQKPQFCDRIIYFIFFLMDFSNFKDIADCLEWGYLFIFNEKWYFLCCRHGPWL